MNSIKVSVIIPVYNVEKYLRKCIDSVVGQTYENLEIIIIDDGSKDGSRSICNEYAEKDKRIRFMPQENTGIAIVRNRSLAAATGEYVYFIDSDDWLDPKTIETLVSIAERENVDVVASQVFFHAKEDQVVDNSDFTETEYSARDFVYLMTRPAGVFCFPCARLIRRSLFPANPFPEGKIFEDLLTMPNIFWHANKIILISAKFYYYRYTSTGLSHGKFSYRAMYEMDGYISVVDLGIEHSDWAIARNGILFYLTKYYYYWWRILFHKMDMKWYRQTYKSKAREYWGMMFCRSKRKGMK